MLDTTGTLIALILSIITLIGIIGSAFYWKATIDNLMKCTKDVPGRTVILETKMDIIWQLCVDQNLATKPHLAKRGSGYKLTEEGEKIISTLADKIAKLQKEYPDIKPSDILVVVSKEIGMEELQRIGHETGCSMADLMSLLTVKLVTV
jgi:hypothetical protein